MGVARALVTGSGCAPEWICLVSKRQFSGADMACSCVGIGAGSSRPRPFRQYGCGIPVDNVREMLRNLPVAADGGAEHPASERSARRVAPQSAGVGGGSVVPWRHDVR
ncbi:hypothetical protein GCM10009776_05930 [Microbacterium deminutum]|uniref:Uncharacterized protein n=1 Tax=Microbacterium deminutum TaxID=344164 RepID=A0ABN2Q7Y0_9MICO